MLDPRLFIPDRERPFCADTLRRPLPERGDTLRFLAMRDPGRDGGWP